MDLTVQSELEHVEQMAVTAARTGERHRDEAVGAAAAHASIALATLLHVGMLTRAEEADWRERLGTALGDPKRLALRGYTITVQGGPQRERTIEERARSAYSACQGLSLTQLAWAHHTAATESAIADALAADASDPERVRRACALGFADRGKEQVTQHEF